MHCFLMVLGYECISRGIHALTAGALVVWVPRLSNMALNPTKAPAVKAVETTTLQSRPLEAPLDATSC
jgi:hypothetical protein